mgnify:CR=1 FL=1
MDRILRVISCLLLLGILVVQIFILRRMPPTLNEILKATGKAQEELMLKRPIIQARISEPVQVEVSNTPLEVEIYR